MNYTKECVKIGRRSHCSTHMITSTHMVFKLQPKMKFFVETKMS
jgi:hypothetical protein